MQHCNQEPHKICKYSNPHYIPMPQFATFSTRHASPDISICQRRSFLSSKKRNTAAAQHTHTRFFACVRALVRGAPPSSAAVAAADVPRVETTTLYIGTATLNRPLLMGLFEESCARLRVHIEKCGASRTRVPDSGYLFYTPLFARLFYPIDALVL